MDGLTDTELVEFKKTSLYRNHFSTGLILESCDKSIFVMQDTGNYIRCHYTVKKYKHSLWFYGENITNVLRDYINCTDILLQSYPDFDIRYYKNHRPELIIGFESDYYLCCYDYNYWLAQGFKPRCLELWCDQLEDIPDHIEYLNIRCRQEVHNHDNIPGNILFVELDCAPKTSDVKDAFYRYTFKRLWTKSSRFEVMANAQ